VLCFDYLLSSVISHLESESDTSPASAGSKSQRANSPKDKIHKIETKDKLLASARKEKREVESNVVCTPLLPLANSQQPLLGPFYLRMPHLTFHMLPLL
jgi:hypothetical protein